MVQLGGIGSVVGIVQPVFSARMDVGLKGWFSWGGLGPWLGLFSSIVVFGDSSNGGHVDSIGSSVGVVGHGVDRLGDGLLHDGLALHGVRVGHGVGLVHVHGGG